MIVNAPKLTRIAPIKGRRQLRVLRGQRSWTGEQGGAEPGRAVRAGGDSAAQARGQGGRERRGRVQDRFQPEAGNHPGTELYAIRVQCSASHIQFRDHDIEIWL